MECQLMSGDVLEVLQDIEPCSVDCVITDPPYEIGMMERGWDKTGIACDPSVWSSVLDKLKPGGHLISFAGARTYHRIATAIEDGGFEIRNQLMWLFGTSFPKGTNIGKAMEKNGMCEKHDCESWKEWGTQLKAGHEPLVLAQKPYEKGKSSFVTCSERGVGGLNLCLGEEGRRTSNVILHSGMEEFFGHKTKYFNIVEYDAPFHYCRKVGSVERNGGLEGMEKKMWLSDGDPKNWDMKEGTLRSQLGKSKHENSHPTVKPIELIRFLINLVLKDKGGVVLDPFCGSGSHVIAAGLEGHLGIGIDIDRENIDIASKRFKYWEEKASET